MKNAQLFAPEAYWKLSPAQQKALCNGCGTDTTWFVPDTIWGLRITPACNIHDYMYKTGTTIEDKHSADRAFLNNMLRLIRAKTRLPWMIHLRVRRARIYYEAVHLLGGPAFWAGKNAPGEMGTVS